VMTIYAHCFYTILLYMLECENDRAHKQVP
jgi:hypothetical protein